MNKRTAYILYMILDKLCWAIHSVIYWQEKYTKLSFGYHCQLCMWGYIIARKNDISFDEREDS